MRFDFTVPGRPKSWKRPGQNARRRYDASAGEKAAIKDTAMVAMREAGIIDPFAGPVMITMTCHFATSRRHPDPNKPFTSKPDIDNLAKIVMDALNKLAYHDDAQVFRLNIEKVRSDEERTYVSVCEVNK